MGVRTPAVGVPHAEPPAGALVILVDGERIGLSQRSVVRDYPEDFNEFAAIVDVPDGAVELDSLVGDAARRSRGLGARMIAAVVDEHLMRKPHRDRCARCRRGREYRILVCVGGGGIVGRASLGPIGLLP